MINERDFLKNEMKKPLVKKIITLAAFAGLLLQSCGSKDVSVIDDISPEALTHMSDTELRKTEEKLLLLTDSLRSEVAFTEQEIDGVYDAESYARKAVMDGMNISGDPYRDTLDGNKALMVESVAQLIREKNTIAKNQTLGKTVLIPKIDF